MKIKLAILDNDQAYMNRIISVFSTKFSDKLEIYSFTSLDVALATIKHSAINVFVASDTFNFDVSKLPSRCGFAYLVESENIETVKDQPVLFKFQKADVIYKEILGIFSERLSSSTGLRSDSESSVVVYTFLSANSGAGSSTLAAAFSKYLAGKGKKVMYLNLEWFGSADMYFSGEGQFGFGDVIFAVKSNKSNLSLKLESYVKQDASGVYFYSATKTALDMAELKSEDIKKLIEELKIADIYGCIILDMDFDLSKKTIDILKNSWRSIFISDGSELANYKFLRAYASLQIIEQQNDIALLDRVGLFYNKFSNKTSKMIDDEGIVVLGGIPKFEHAASAQIIDQLLNMNVFDKLLEG